MRKGKRGQKVIPSASRGALNPKDRLRQQAYALRAARNFGEARPLLEELYKLEPDNMPLALDLGEAYMETEDFGAATSLYAKLIEKDPKNISAVTNLGGSLIRQGKLNDARSILEYALQLDPKSIHARINLGSVLQASGERKANLDNALEAVQIDPSSSLAFNNLGSAFSDMAMFKEAKHAYETAVILDSNQVDALINLGAVEARLGNREASTQTYERVLKKLPTEAKQRAEAVKFYASFEYLKQGMLQKGWEYYEGGFSPLVPSSGARSPKRTFNVPLWEGGDLKGRTLLIWREQGLGDELLFFTCLRDLGQMGEKIIVECDARLVEDLARSFPHFIVRAEAFQTHANGRSVHSDFDCHLPAGSLMRIFRPTHESFLTSGSYIKPKESLVKEFRVRLGKVDEGKKFVGICWRSGKLNPVRNLSYTELTDWADFLKDDNIIIVNLQYGECEAELQNLESTINKKVIRWADLNMKNDLDRIFALMSCLDIVVSVQTAVATMAGAVGKPTLIVKGGGWTHLGIPNVFPWFERVRKTSMQALASNYQALLHEDDSFRPWEMNIRSKNYVAIERLLVRPSLQGDLNEVGYLRLLILEARKANSFSQIAQDIRALYQQHQHLKDGLSHAAHVYHDQTGLMSLHELMDYLNEEYSLGRMTSNFYYLFVRLTILTKGVIAGVELMINIYSIDKHLYGYLTLLASDPGLKIDHEDAQELFKLDCKLKRPPTKSQIFRFRNRFPGQDLKSISTR